ncbi:branched-chain amino acid ABC transporter permease [Methylocapsa sp. S129]|uniref:branched-chain amino acid ABC transporter permease n=1 Tax=Methylocapsa sp. S129 TaxID=1641869 RepID=UPI00131AB0B6|nr:branched-chain amino acid ABC transporter permease [Methylocapsa sp. S129]
MAQATKRLRLARGGLLDLRNLGAAALLCLLLALPFVVGGFLLYTLTLCFANALGALSVSLLVRYSGEVSIGHSFFVALGAYAVAIMEKQFGLSLLLSLPVAVLLGIAGGIIFAYPSRRLSGIYLAVSTMALALALPEILVHSEKVTGGFEGLYVTLVPLPSVAKELQRYYIALAILVVACLALAQLRGSRQGLALLMARAHPSAAEAFGITRGWARVSVFAISAALASVGGAVMAFASSTVSPNSFTLWSSIFLLVGSVVSLNRLTLPAGIIGGAFLTLVPNYLASAGDWVPILYGAALVAVTLCVNCASDIRLLLARRERP